MKFLYSMLKHLFLFFFVVSLFGPVIRFQQNAFQSVIFPAILFALFMALMPQILAFMKIKDSLGTMFLGSIVVIFLYYFIGFYALDLFNILASNQKIILWGTFGFTIGDQTLALIVLSIASSTLSVIMQMLQKSK